MTEAYRDPRDLDDDPRSILRWFVRGAVGPDDMAEIVVPEGPATFVCGDRWVYVPRGATKIAMVGPGVRPRLATEADLHPSG